jgi:hypothetical protein
VIVCGHVIYLAIVYCRLLQLHWCLLDAGLNNQLVKVLPQCIASDAFKCSYTAQDTDWLGVKGQGFPKGLGLHVLPALHIYVYIAVCQLCYSQS